MRNKILLACTALCAPTGVAAQGAAQALPDSAGEIIVTAQKREQSLQDVPIVVTVLQEEALRDAGVRDIKDLTILTPGLQMVSTSSEATTTARLRNIGTAGENPGLESSVGIEIDGVYRPRAGVGLGDLGEIERIEVLKGPQGTLFGKNSSAGVIRVITKKPEFTPGGSADLTIGNFDAFGVSAGVTGPIVTDLVAGRLSMVRRKRDGFYDVRVGEGPRSASDDQTQDYASVRGQLLFTPSADLDIRLIADYSRREERCCVAVATEKGPAAAIIDALTGADPTPATPWERVAYSNRDTQQEIEDKGISAEVSWTTPWLGHARLTSITALRDWKALNGEDSDFTAADIWYRVADDLNSNRFTQFSQEIRLSGSARNWDWLVGGFYANEQLDRNSTHYYGDAYEPYLGLLLSDGAHPDFVSILTGQPFGTNYSGLNTKSLYRQESNSFALFTNQTLRIGSKLSLTAGLRYTREEKILDTSYFNGDSPACAAALDRIPTIAAIVGATNLETVLGTLCLPWADASFDGLVTKQKRREREWSGEIKASYRFGKGLMVYGGYARGYKAGGFNLDRARKDIGVPETDTSFGSETVDSFEIGAKATLLEGNLLLDGALFDQTFAGYQLNVFTGISFAVAGLPEVRSRGADINLLWRTPLSGFTLQGGVTYAETEYGVFKPPAGLSPDISGARLPNAPRWSGALAGTFEWSPAGGLKQRANISALYTSRYPMSATDLSRTQASILLVNARLGLGTQDDRWTAEIWAQNLTGEEYYQAQFDAPLQPGSSNGFLGNPRTFGVTLRYQF
jgi:outer membrane receptor protein involved in Fe transport